MSAFQHTTQSMYNVAKLGCNQISANLMGMAPVLLVNILPARNTVNAHEQNSRHTTLISTYFIMNKFASACECDVVLLTTLPAIF